MKIDLMISADHIDRKKIKGKTVVIIDVLRATSVIVTAINNGCSKVVPVLSMEEAFEYAKENLDQCILGGERNALKIEGFNCSNSPLEYTKEVISGKTLVMTTSNGTRAIKASEDAKNILIGSMINGEAVAEKVLDFGEDLVIVNSGTNGEFSMDDFICAGYLIYKIRENEEELELTDIARTALMSYDNHKDIISFIKDAVHYKRLKSLGLEEDLEYCFKKDTVHIVPQYKNCEIK
ncbi:2-phosphosulfolactate phosphatase family protein [Hathewaya massiliensis]|uniref:2-phosphosulfolactate phosphatase family protein n=1 Tax=Hathewaya massiliensis TaxID=1964382 RepID=UPI00115B5738|nr:2-phosphosulfolactate phosphatase family protein [Hathewaya massiliensis]